MINGGNFPTAADTDTLTGSPARLPSGSVPVFPSVKRVQKSIYPSPELCEAVEAIAQKEGVRWAVAALRLLELGLERYADLEKAENTTK